MARPPRIPVMLPWECSVMYFVTICVVPQCNALANDAAWRALCQTLKRLNKWNTYCVLMMPDHLHLLTAPLERELSVANSLNWLKRWFNEAHELPARCQSQPGGFDRLLRTSESIHEKWQYISRESRSCRLGRALETVAISPRILRRRNVRFESGSASDTKLRAGAPEIGREA